MSVTRDELEWELAEYEVEGSTVYMNHREQKELLISGMSGYKDYSDKELIEWIRNYHDSENLMQMCDEFEASLAVDEMLKDPVKKHTIVLEFETDATQEELMEIMQHVHVQLETVETEMGKKVEGSKVILK